MIERETLTRQLSLFEASRGVPNPPHVREAHEAVEEVERRLRNACAISKPAHLLQLDDVRSVCHVLGSFSAHIRSIAQTGPAELLSRGDWQQVGTNGRPKPINLLQVWLEGREGDLADLLVEPEEAPNGLSDLRMVQDSLRRLDLSHATAQFHRDRSLNELALDPDVWTYTEGERSTLFDHWHAA